MNTKTTTIVRTLLGSKALWVGVVLVTTRIVMEQLDQNRVVSGIALIVGILLMVVGIGLGIWRVMQHLVDHEGWRGGATGQRHFRNALDHDQDPLVYDPAYRDLGGNIYHSDFHYQDTFPADPAR